MLSTPFGNISKRIEKNERFQWHFYFYQLHDDVVPQQANYQQHSY